MRYEEATTPICVDCAATVARYPKNQDHKDEWIAKCLACGVEFCVHYSSEIDTRYCGNCKFDFYIETKVEGKSSTKNSAVKDTTYHGTEHLFMIRKIRSMPETDQLNMAQYHYNVFNSVMNDMEEQRIARYRLEAAHRAVKLNTPNASTIPQGGKVKRGKAKVKPLTREEAIHMLTQLSGKTPSEDVIRWAMGLSKEGSTE